MDTDRPVPAGAFIVNIGDILEIMSNEEFKSIEHRAVMNPETECLSLQHSLTKENNGAIYESVDWDEYLKFALSRELDGKSAINHMKLEN
ncbi:hypothetical protein AAG906_034075 [Vitis piasezkii]